MEIYAITGIGTNMKAATANNRSRRYSLVWRITLILRLCLCLVTICPRVGRYSITLHFPNDVKLLTYARGRHSTHASCAYRVSVRNMLGFSYSRLLHGIYLCQMTLIARAKSLGEEKRGGKSYLW